MSGYIIYSDEYLKLNFGADHPFQPKRFYDTYQLMKELLHAEVLAPKIIKETLLVELGIHSSDYIERVKACSRLEIQFLSEYSADTPCFRGIFDWALAYCGGAISGCEIIINRKRGIVFNIAGGYHHAKIDSDGGFCVFNDCALALRYFMSRGLTPIYIDIDGHAGDGTYMILYEDPIFKISIHEDPSYLYPGHGFVHEMGRKEGLGYTVNIPLPPHATDSDFIYVFENIVEPILKSTSFDAIVLQAGVDGFFLDPLTHLDYSKKTYEYVAEALKRYGKPILICPGGGYSKYAAMLHTILFGLLTSQKSNIEKLLKSVPELPPKEVLKSTREIVNWILTNHKIRDIVNL